jgi:hypothetical protein
VHSGRAAEVALHLADKQLNESNLLSRQFLVLVLRPAKSIFADLLHHALHFPLFL